MFDFDSCPFCGGSGGFLIKTTFTKGNSIGWHFGVSCSNCGITIRKKDYTVEVQLKNNGEISTLTDERLIALNDWNRRSKV